MTEKEAIAYIEAGAWSATRPGLERTRTLLAALGDPQKKLRFVHVAGSNGKGSTCAMLDSVLRSAGYRTGLYTSPHICSFRERIKVNGEDISGEEFAEQTERVRAAAEKMADHPSQFELATAVAMMYFLKMGCDIVVLEVGMGGALDSTNVIGPPEVAVITNIGLEHTEYLGDTLEKIAAAKAGIIKPGCSAVCYDGAAEVKAVVSRVCGGLNVPLKRADLSGIVPLEHDLHGQTFMWQGLRLGLPLLGEHQLRNAATALAALTALRERGWNISDAAIRSGMASVRWPARFEVLSFEPLFILDGGHNPQCAEAIEAMLEDYLPGRKITFLMGVLADKDYTAMLDAVSPRAARFVCLTPESGRALPAERLSGLAASRGFGSVSCGDAETAVAESLRTPEPVVAFGSLYMAGMIMRAFPGALSEWQLGASLRGLTARTEGDS